MFLVLILELHFEILNNRLKQINANCLSQKEKEKWRDVYVTVKGRQTDKQADKAAHDVTVRMHKVCLTWETDEDQASV